MNPGLRRAFCALLLPLAAAACTDEPEGPLFPSSGEAFARTLESGGRQRTYQVFVPNSVDASRAAPLVIALHPSPTPGAGKDMRGLSGFDQVARPLEMIFAYPDAAQAAGGGRLDWDEGCGCSQAEQAGVDDVQFIRDMIDDIATELTVDRSRIYVTGFSQGGLAAEHMACAMAEEVAAVAVVAATMSRALLSSCDPAEPVPFLLIHGTADPISPASGTTSGSRPLASVEETLEFWLDVNGCPATPSESVVLDDEPDGTKTIENLWQNCQGDSEVVFYEVEGGGHTWPNVTQDFPAANGPTGRDIIAAFQIGLFFDRH